MGVTVSNSTHDEHNDSHNDSHNSTKVDSHNTTDSHNLTLADSHNDSHNSIDSHNNYSQNGLNDNQARALLDTVSSMSGSLSRSVVGMSNAFAQMMARTQMSQMSNAMPDLFGIGA